MAIISQKYLVILPAEYTPAPSDQTSYWGRAKADSFLHFSLPKNPTIGLLGVGFLCFYIVDMGPVL
jgi:hypothetical protein